MRLFYVQIRNNFNIKKLVLALSLLFLIHCCAKAQNVGIATIAPDSTAILDVKSSNKGFLIPRMTLAQRLAIQISSQIPLTASFKVIANLAAGYHTISVAPVVPTQIDGNSYISASILEWPF